MDRYSIITKNPEPVYSPFIKEQVKWTPTEEEKRIFSEAIIRESQRPQSTFISNMDL